jgi:hypothetical protein
MKLTLTLLVASLAAPTTAASDYENSVACALKNPDINTAIQAFCAKTDIVAPSKYAHKGKGHNDVHVRIFGKCSPVQWVPTIYCESQFHEVCANNKHGLGVKHFGRDGCQHFHIGKHHKPLPDPMGEIGL